jgi:glycosyltransferase involved in cell wall biosynthesis
MTRVAMNLLWCVPGVGGSEEYLVRQLVGLTEIDHQYEVDVFAPRGFTLRHPELAEHYSIIEAPSACTRREQRVVLEHTWLAARTRAYDIVHHGGGSIPRIGNGNTLLTLHDVQWVDYPQYVRPIKLRYLRNMVPSSLKRAARIAVPSQFVAHTLTAAFGTPASKIGVVRHGLQSDFVNVTTSADELRQKYNLGDGPVLVFPAITHPHKNHEFLLRMLATGGGSWADPTLRMVFAGSDGLAEQSVQSLIQELQLNDRVVMPGRVSDADRNGLLAMADAMVFPSMYEGFGAPVIEAMRSGTPVVCSDQGSLPEVVGDAGLVRELTVSAWSDALDTVRTRREEFIAAGRNRAQVFTAALSAQDLVTQYDVIASSRKK